jgi:regulator of protease activity HflC (stomatin/prohibitin superfamily)
LTTVALGKFGIGRAARPWALIWAVFLVTTLVVTRMSALGALFMFFGTALIGYVLVQLILAKGKVLSGREVSLWKGTTKLVSWNPTEGVLFLRNKQIDIVDDNPHDGGGIRVVYPLLGEELVLRVPLEIQTLRFEDTQVLTKEYMPLTIKGMMYWKISNLSRFYLLISKEIHSLSDNGGHSSLLREASTPQLEVAEHWLRAMAEEKTRQIVSRLGTGLLIADQLVSDLPKALLTGETQLGMNPQSSTAYRSATDSLADTIKVDFESSVREYGLEIHRVALQEIRLPPEIYKAAVEACQSAYLPLKAQAEALERKLKLQAEVDVIGKDAVGMKEIAANIPALAFQEFLSPLFLDFNRKRGIEKSAGV